MPLTNAQLVQVGRAAGQAKVALRAFYNEQNSGKVPGQSRDSKQSNGRRSGRGRNAGHAKISNMPAPHWGERGVMPAAPDYQQTPASSNIIAPRGFGYYDAFAHDAGNVGTAMSIGPSTPITATTLCQGVGVTSQGSGEMSGGAVDGLESGALLVIVYPACESKQAVSWRVSSNDPANSPLTTQYKSPQLEANPPMSAIPTRCSFRIKNTTANIGVGGVVRFLRLTTGVTLDTRSAVTSSGQTMSTNADVVDLMEHVRTHARTRSYCGHELVDSMQKNATVVDQSKATSFLDFDLVAYTEQYAWTELAGWPQTSKNEVGTYGNWTVDMFTEGIHTPSFTPMAILIEPFLAGGVSSAGTTTVGNTYEIMIRSQFLGHFPQGTMLANMARTVPANPNEMNKHRDAEESSGSTLMKVVDTVSQVMPYVAMAGSAARMAAPYLGKGAAMFL